MLTFLRFTYRTVLSFLLLAIVVVFGCNEDQPSPAAANKNSPSAPPPPPPPPSSIAPPPAANALPTDEECKQFAESLIKAIKEGDKTRFYQLFDMTAMMDIAIGDITNAPQSKQIFTTEILKGKENSNDFASQLIAKVKAGEEIRMLHVHEQGNQKRILLRIYHSSGAVSYADFILKKQANGTISAVDYLDIRLGELKSTVFRHIFLPFASKESGASFSNPTLDAFAKNWSSVQEIQQARQAKDFQKALQLYKQLPPELQKERICLNEAIGASQKISPEEYFSVLETFKSAFPNDPFVDLTLTDYYILQKDYDKCIECILRLDKYLGGDAVQNNHAATIYFNQEKYDEARKMAEKAIELENDFLPAYENLLLISFKEKNFDKSVNLLEILNEKFKMNIHELPPNSSNEDFLKSPQYQEWLKKQNSTGDSPKPE